MRNQDFNHPNRREFMWRSGAAAALLAGSQFPTRAAGADLFSTFQNPPREYSVIPFWFLNDDLSDEELKRQLDDFAAHGVYGVIPHPRIGLPEDIAWMSDRWMHFLKTVVDHAAANDMSIILYDEAMYPSGSCHGQVVAANPMHATRCIVRMPLDDIAEEEHAEIVYRDDEFAYVHTFSNGRIRGVHFGADDSDPGAPPSADLLNPESVASFLHLTHDKHYEVLSEHFGKTVQAIFTDEPTPLGRRHRRGAQEWTWGFGDFLEEYLGYDFLPHLPALWSRGEEGERYRNDFEHAVNARLEEVYYKPYSDWCVAHNVALAGHPDGPMDIGTLKYFQMPGQDVVWRYLEPFQEKSIEGAQSTMGKCSASAQVHYGRKRNMNECFGAYGWNFTYDEMRWVTDWLLVRGTNLLIPHAFYYSIRGPRRDERPPDVGPNNVWWDDYKTYADYCSRICWLLAEGTQVCDVAILGTPISLPWRAARVCFEHQRDFNYLDTDTLLKQAKVTADGISVGEMHYKALIIDGPEAATDEALAQLKPFIDAGRVIAYGDAIESVSGTVEDAAGLVAQLARLAPADVTPSGDVPNLRYHHVHFDAADIYFFTNEGADDIDTQIKVAATGVGEWWDAEKGAVLADQPADIVRLAPYKSLVLCVKA